MKKKESKQKKSSELRKRAEEKLKPIDDEDFKVDVIIKKPFDFSALTKQVNDAFGSG